MPNHIIPMQLTEDNVNIPVELTNPFSVSMELTEPAAIQMDTEPIDIVSLIIEDAQNISMTVRLMYSDEGTAIAGLAIAGIAIAGVA